MEKKFEVSEWNLLKAQQFITYAALSNV